MENLRWLFIEAFVFGFLLIYYLRGRSIRWGLVDKPDWRKRHGRAVPLIGGIAIFASFVLVAGPMTGLSQSGLVFLACGSILVLIGVLDDYFDYPPSARFAAQIAAALGMAIAGVALYDLGAILPTGELLVLGALAIPLTVFATVGLINAFNMIDGVDGLAGSLSLVALAALALLAAVAGQAEPLQRLLTLSGCVAAFLFYNLRTPMRRAATAFLGDSGSMFLGFALAWFLINLSQGSARILPPAAALWLVAIPLMDTLYCMLRRLANGHSPFAPDRRHLHHLLLELGFSVRRAVATLAGVATLLAAVGVVAALAGWSQFFMAAAFTAMFGAYCLTLTLVWRQLDAEASALPDQPWDSMAAVKSGPGKRG